MWNTVLWLPGQRHLKGLLGRGTTGSHRRQGGGPLFVPSHDFQSVQIRPGSTSRDESWEGGGAVRPKHPLRVRPAICVPPRCAPGDTPSRVGLLLSACRIHAMEFLGTNSCLRVWRRATAKRKATFFDKQQINTKLSGETAAFILAGALPLRQNP